MKKKIIGCIKVHVLPIMSFRKGNGIMLTRKQLKELQSHQSNTNKKEDLVNINELNIPIDKYFHEKIGEYFKFIKNPYHFRVDDTEVDIHFGDGKSFSQSIMDVVTNQDNY